MTTVLLCEERGRIFMTVTFMLLENIRNKTSGDYSSNNVGQKGDNDPSALIPGAPLFQISG